MFKLIGKINNKIIKRLTLVNEIIILLMLFLIIVPIIIGIVWPHTMIFKLRWIAYYLVVFGFIIIYWVRPGVINLDDQFILIKTRLEIIYIFATFLFLIVTILFFQYNAQMAKHQLQEDKVAMMTNLCYEYSNNLAVAQKDIESYDAIERLVESVKNQPQKINQSAEVAAILTGQSQPEFFQIFILQDFLQQNLDLFPDKIQDFNADYQLFDLANKRLNKIDDLSNLIAANDGTSNVFAKIHFINEVFNNQKLIKDRVIARLLDRLKFMRCN